MSNKTLSGYQRGFSYDDGFFSRLALPIPPRTKLPMELKVPQGSTGYYDCTTNQLLPSGSLKLNEVPQPARVISAVGFTPLAVNSL